MIPIWNGVTMRKQASRKRRGSQASQTTTSSSASVAAAVAAWKPCGRSCCVYQPGQEGSGPFS